MHYLCVIVTLYYWIWSRVYPHLPQDFTCFYFIKLGLFLTQSTGRVGQRVDVRSTSGRCPSCRSRRAQTSHTNLNFANREEKLHSSSVSTSGAGYTQALDIYCSNGATEELFCYSRMLIPEYIQCRFFANKIFIFLKDTLPVFLQISP